MNPFLPRLSRVRGARYRCPMHASYTSDKPGTCPICGMNLVPIADGGGGGGVRCL